MQYPHWSASRAPARKPLPGGPQEVCAEYRGLGANLTERGERTRVNAALDAVRHLGPDAP